MDNLIYLICRVGQNHEMTRLQTSVRFGAVSLMALAVACSAHPAAPTSPASAAATSTNAEEGVTLKASAPVPQSPITTSGSPKGRPRAHRECGSRELRERRAAIPVSGAGRRGCGRPGFGVSREPVVHGDRGAGLRKAPDLASPRRIPGCRRPVVGDSLVHHAGGRLPARQRDPRSPHQWHDGRPRVRRHVHSGAGCSSRFARELRGKNGRQMENLSARYTGPYNPNPHIVRLGSVGGRAGSDTNPGTIIRNVWVSANARPVFSGER